MKNRKTVITVAAIFAAIAGILGASLFLGLDSGTALIGIGCALGAYLGVSWGNKQAKKTDAYREQWLNKRKNPSSKVAPDNQAPTQLADPSENTGK
ncbi:hypothetical protein [uncultured Arthrobacter sp.]|uniref:hypothetical protein n=1 Tax=uncultured Arthrobacter sp. TaxID=114050 RepID=UPI00261AF93D|nr:hypothetical protein [uncultured Arthrobacter sp.]